MTTVKSDRDAKSKPPAQLLAKQVNFVVNLESSSENAGCTENLDLKAKEFPVKQGIGAVSGKVKIESGDAMDIEGVLDTENMLVRPDGQGNSCMAEPNGQDQEDQEEGKGGIMGDGQDFSEEDESRDNGVVGDVINGDWPPREASLRPQGLVLQQQQPQAQGPIIRWERFLAQRCLKVLLVENDDSTRQVVSALLRNCSYEVTAIANGLQAWKLLEDPSNHFDLVLTEVVMPCLSGIGLLCKIMAHKTCKNIPVIMMSSHDSMGIVFKCLSKGAVDFLVKPVRKNELKNLWQHVWRRCHSSSGSGSETGSQTQKILMPRSEDDSDNNTGSNDESDDASISLNVRDGSDNGSGTQSSWTKRAVEVESPRQRSEWEPSQPLSSTIAQVIQPKMETIQNDWIPLAGTSGECQDEKPYDSEMGQDLEIAVPRQKGTELKCHQEEKALCNQACAREENAPLANSGEGNQIHEGPARTSGSPSGEAASKAVDLIGAIASKPKVGDLELENNESREILEKGMNSSQMKDKTTSDFKYLPFLELTLKRPRQSGDEDGEPEDRHVLRQSGGSAFSRYNTSGAHVSHPSGTSFPPNVYSLPNGHRGHSCVPSGSLGTGKTGSLRVTIPIERVGSSKGSGGDASTPGTMHQLSHGSNNQDLGSVVCPSGQERFPRAAPIKDETLSASNVGPQLGKPMSRHCGVIPYDAVPSAYGSAIHPMYYSHTGAPRWGPETQHVKERGDVCDNSAQNEQQLPRPRTLQNQVQHHHHHHHIQHVHHHHHHHQTHQHKHLHEHPKQEEQTINNVAVTAPRCGSSNMVGNAPDGNTCQSGSNNGYGSNGNGNGSVNGSASGSNNGSNGLNGHSNGQSSAAVTPGTNGESDTGIGMKSSAGGGSGSGVDQNRVAQREAALTKFRQKRKERCFEKKVRYQSRKRLAEQRPRVRGQFVRQPMHEPTNDEAE